MVDAGRPVTAWRMARATAAASSRTPRRCRSPQKPIPTSAARAGDAAQLVVGEVAHVVAGALHAGVRDHHRPPGHGHRVRDGAGRGVGEVEQDPPLLQAAHQRHGRVRRESALRHAVGGARPLRVEEVRRGDHAEAGVEERVHAAPRSPSSACAPSRPRNPAVMPGCVPAPIEVAGHVVTACAAGSGVRPIARPCLAACAPGGGHARAGWSRSAAASAAHDGQGRDHVAAVVVALVVEAAWALGDDGEGLDGDVALDEPGHVDVAAVRRSGRGRAPTAASRRGGRRWSGARAARSRARTAADGAARRPCCSGARRGRAPGRRRRR